MERSWTFGQKIAGGFAAVVVLAVIVGAIGVFALKAVVTSKDRIIEVHAQNLVEAERLHASTEARGGALRGFLLTREERFVDELRPARANFATIVGHVRAVAGTDAERQAVDQLERAEADYAAALDRLVASRRSDAPLEAVTRAFDADVVPRRSSLDQTVSGFAALEQRLLDEGKRAATETASTASMLVGVVSTAAVLLGIMIAFFLTKTLTRQISGAVQHVRSSSTELQTAASQQASGAKEQATAMSEITTTISELLATSRQIAESAQRVAQIAEDTARSARSGDAIVVKTSDSMSGIKRQVDLIVSHMLDLGRKSQQIGGILELINELADQTNILAINATIEAAGAGDAGKRFGVVADEIRKLADRVAGSTKEIRGLIDEVRTAVNATVMTTEGGTKAVDAGARQFAEVAVSFKQIAGLVSTTTEAAREIELSTKQQSTAVEQVNVAIANVAQATRETEASSNQTFQTASQLTVLSRELTRLIQAHAGT